MSVMLVSSLFILGRSLRAENPAADAVSGNDAPAAQQQTAQSGEEHTVKVANGAVMYAEESIDEAKAFAAAHPERMATFQSYPPGLTPEARRHYRLAAMRRKASSNANTPPTNTPGSSGGGTPDAAGSGVAGGIPFSRDVGYVLGIDDDGGDDDSGPSDGVGSDDQNLDIGYNGPFISFQGPNTCGCEPPDPTLTVGTNHVLFGINNQIRASNKTTGATNWTVAWNAFFSSVNPGGSFTSDPKLFFDPGSQRYFVTILYVATDGSGNPTKSWWMLGVSTTDNITDSTTTWRKWAFDPTVADPGKFADYPSFGFDTNAIYITSNMFNGPTVDLAVFPKAQLLVATPTPTFSQIVNVKTSTNATAFTVQPCLMYNTSADCYFVSATGGSGNSIFTYQINNPLGSPTLTKGSLAVPSYSFPPDATQKGSSTQIAVNDSRLINASYRGGTINSIVTAHNTASGAIAAARWYQINMSGGVGAPSLTQSGTYNNGGSSTSCIYPSVVMDQNGSIGMGFTLCSSTEFTSAYHTSHLANDSPGFMATATLDHAGTAAYTSSGHRWGDYSGMAIDPVDFTTFWTLQEFATGSTSWSTWATSFQLSLCPAMTITPSSLPLGGVGAFYSQSLSTSGGTGPYTYTLFSGSLPANVSLSSAGVISGTPTTTGSSSFTVKSTDSTTCFGTKTYTISVFGATCSLSPPTETDPVGTSQSVTVTVLINGSPAAGVPVNFNVTAGPNIGASGSGSTDANGQAVYTYTGSGGAGTDTIAASGLGFSVAPFNCTATKTWTGGSCSLLGDLNGDTVIDGLDIAPFTDCLINGTSPGNNCTCGDFDSTGTVDLFDVGPFVNVLIN